MSLASDSQSDSSAAARMTCPNCDVDLTSTSTGRGIAFACLLCGGQSVSVSVLRKTLGEIFVRDLWRQAKAIVAGKGKGCPTCNRAMCDIVARADHGDVHVDVCTRCQIVWFDADEVNRFPPPPPQKNEQLPPAAREALAMAHLQLDQRREQIQDMADNMTGTGMTVHGNSWLSTIWRLLRLFLLLR